MKKLEDRQLQYGTQYDFNITLLSEQPDAIVPEDVSRAIVQNVSSKSSWDSISNLARIDWVHWIESAKQAQTRELRIQQLCQQLAQGKTSICCFDHSGFYSKAFKAPEAMQQ